MYKEDLALNNLQWLICHKTQPNQIIYMYKEDLALNNLQWLICHKTKPNQKFIDNLGGIVIGQELMQALFGGWTSAETYMQKRKSQIPSKIFYYMKLHIF